MRSTERLWTQRRTSSVKRPKPSTRRLFALARSAPRQMQSTATSRHCSETAQEGSRCPVPSITLQRSRWSRSERPEPRECSSAACRRIHSPSCRSVFAIVFDPTFVYVWLDPWQWQWRESGGTIAVGGETRGGTGKRRAAAARQAVAGRSGFVRCVYFFLGSSTGITWPWKAA